MICRKASNRIRIDYIKHPPVHAIDAYSVGVLFHSLSMSVLDGGERSFTLGRLNPEEKAPGIH